MGAMQQAGHLPHCPPCHMLAAACSMHLAQAGHVGGSGERETQAGGL